ncbi:uncharacterized protein TNCT_12781 [Trichonephila clavata]|uniref:Uncharacterized protein n=1 Tax=Trichonephila clavata TaxID=2740835 RepID=A0A8X6G688_TRICU|nr:uncharacterized protein TNCT_12781 [Trichonephila clavata]
MGFEVSKRLKDLPKPFPIIDSNNGCCHSSNVTCSYSRSPSDASRSRWGGGAEPVLGPCRLRSLVRGVRLPPSTAPTLPHPPTARSPLFPSVPGRRRGGQPPLLPDGAGGG